MHNLKKAWSCHETHILNLSFPPPPEGPPYENRRICAYSIDVGSVSHAVTTVLLQRQREPLVWIQPPQVGVHLCD